MEQQVLLPPLVLTTKPLIFKIHTDIVQLRIASTRCNESKHRYLSDNISFIGERVPSETDKFMLSVGTTESVAIL